MDEYIWFKQVEAQLSKIFLPPLQQYDFYYHLEEEEKKEIERQLHRDSHSYI